MRETGKVRLNVEQRNGRIFVSSDDVPGLFLWGSDPDEVWESVIPAIKSLFRHNKGMEVDVLPDEQPEGTRRWAQVEHMPVNYVVRAVSAEQTAH